MKTLVVGAGGIGGYFGGKLLQAGRDVTFLVRPRRKAQLAQTGLVIKSPKGDVHIPSPPTVTADQLDTPFDLVLLSCKANDLDDAIKSFAPAVGPETVILPLLNGMAHIDTLSARFGAKAVFGGQCLISLTTDAEGRVLHLNDTQLLSFGELDGSRSPRADAIAKELSGAGFDPRLSETILQDMWEKWVFIATSAGITCLMRAAVGDIITAGSMSLTLDLLAECTAIAARNGHKPGEAAAQRNNAMFTAAGSLLTASMLRDIERGAPVEADHVIGDLIRRGDGQSPLLRIVLAHLKSYEARRARQAAATQAAR
jgi:2-dehydropantoate 2-reductase